MVNQNHCGQCMHVHQSQYFQRLTASPGLGNWARTYQFMIWGGNTGKKMSQCVSWAAISAMNNIIQANEKSVIYLFIHSLIELKKIFFLTFPLKIFPYIQPKPEKRRAFFVLEKFLQQTLHPDPFPLFKLLARVLAS